MNANCFKSLGKSAGALKTSEGKMQYFDGRSSEDGPANISQILGPGLNLRLGETFESLMFGTGNAATVLQYTSGQISKYVDLGALFWNMSAVNQGITLVHELLHYTLQMGDLDLAKTYAHYKGSDPVEASKAISAWLKGGCN